MRVFLTMIFLFSSALACADQHVITVGPVGTNYNSIQAAINSVAKKGSAADQYLITVAAGTYTEQVIMDQPYVTLRGAGKDSTIVAKDIWTGYAASSGVLIVTASHIAIEDMTFKNTRRIFTDAGEALSSYSSSPDEVVFNRVYFTNDNSKDTIWLDGNGSYVFNDCKVDGNYDILTIMDGGTYVINNMTAITLGGGGGNQFFWTAESPQIEVSNSQFKTLWGDETYLMVHNSASTITLNFVNSSLSAFSGRTNWVMPNTYSSYAVVRTKDTRHSSSSAVARMWNKYE